VRREDLDLQASVIGRRLKKAIDRVLELHDVPRILEKPKYRRVGAMKALDRDRKLAQSELDREFRQLARLTVIRSKWRPKREIS
jgi:hypothetical protein